EERGPSRSRFGLAKALSILVIVQPTAEDIPHPHVLDGGLVEPFLPLSQASRSALEAALRIRDQATLSSPSPLGGGPQGIGQGEGESGKGRVTAPTVTIQVVAVAARGCASVLREPQSLGADRVRLIIPDADAVTPASAAAAMAAALGSD